MENYDAVFEWICEAHVRPDPEVRCEEYVAVTFTPEPGTPGLPDTMLIFTNPERHIKPHIRKLANTIFYFASQYDSTDESKISFLLWYFDMLCKKLPAENCTGLQYEGLHWYFASREIRFTTGPNRTQFVNLHTFDESCYSPAEMEILREVGDNFRTWVTGEMEVDPEQEGGERELVLSQ